MAVDQDHPTPLREACEAASGTETAQRFASAAVTATAPSLLSRLRALGDSSEGAEPNRKPVTRR